MREILENGVYVIYENGSYKPYSGKNQKKSGVKIGIAQDGHYFAIPLDYNYGNKQLLQEYKERDVHCVSECDALLNWDFKKETEHLKTLGLVPQLKEGHYLPTAPVFLAIYANREKINNALKHFGVQPIDFDDYYWFAQRYSAYYAWYFSGTNKYLYGGSVGYTIQCLAVSLCEPKF